MILQQFVAILTIAAFAQAIDVIDSDKTLDGSIVLFVIDAADLPVNDRSNVLSFTRSMSIDATNKGANVGLMLGSDAYITDPSEFEGHSVEKRLDRVIRFHDEAERSWNQLQEPQLSTSTLSDSLEVLGTRLSYMTTKPKMIVVLVTGASNLNSIELSKQLDQLQQYDIRYTAVLIGHPELAEELTSITDSACLVTRIPSAEKLPNDMRARIRMSLIFGRLASGIKWEDEDSFCRELFLETNREYSRSIPTPSTSTTTQTTTTQISDEEMVRDVRMDEREAIEGVKTDNEQPKEDKEAEEQLQKQLLAEEAERLREEREKQEKAERDRLEQEKLRIQAQLESEKRLKEEETEKMNPARAGKVMEDYKMIEEHKVAEEKPIYETEKVTTQLTTMKPVEVPVTTTTEQEQQLMCYRCDGCGAEAPESTKTINCGSVSKASCFTARIGFGEAATYVRGCEQRSRCVDVDSPVLKRKCCSSPMCNGDMSSDSAKKTTPKPKTPKTTPKPVTTQTTESIPSVELAKSLVNKEEVDATLPFSNVEIYYVVDFAGLTKVDRVELVELAKRLAVDAATLGAEAAVVNGNRIRRVSPYQILLAFENTKKRPTKEDIIRRFDSELHIDPEAPSEPSKGRIHQYYTTTQEPSGISTLPQTFESLVDKLVSRQENDPNKLLFITFLSGAELPQMAGIKLWENHEKIAGMLPHYTALLIGSHTSSEPFVELLENSDNPRCLVMRFDKMYKLASPDTEMELSKLLVESVDYIREHGSLTTFRCGAEPAPPVVRTREPSSTTESTTLTTQPSTETPQTTMLTTANETEPTDERSEQETLHPVVVIPKRSDRANVIVVKPEEEDEQKKTVFDEGDVNKTESGEQSKKPVRTVVEVDVVGKDGEPVEKIVVAPKRSKEQQDENAGMPEAEQIITTSPRPDRRVVVVVKESEEEEEGQATLSTPSQPEKEVIGEDNIEKIVSKIEEKPVPVDDKDTKKQELTVVIVEPNTEHKPSTEIKKKQKKDLYGIGYDEEEQQPSTKPAQTETQPTPSIFKLEDEALPQRVKIDKTRNVTRSGKSGQLMCYQCEHCGAGRPSSNSVVPCGVDDVTSPNRGVCFIQRVGEEYSRGCIEGYECLETQSEVLTNYCCNSQSLCNDVLPSANVIGSASSAGRVHPLSVLATLSLLLARLV